MREPPNLSADSIAAALRERYHLPIAGLAFLPIGADAASAVYRAESVNGASYFVKLRTGGGFDEPSLAIPRYLASQGVPHILAPLPAAGARLWVELNGFALSVYPWLDARTGTDAGLSEQQWRDLGAALARIHACRLPAALEQIVRRETFVPSRRDLLDRIDEAISAQQPPEQGQRELAAFWRARRDDIRAVVARADALAGELRGAELPLALCHADLHTWNVLVDDAGQLWIVDWDEVVLAPKERDLMFVVGGIGRDLVSPRETACFLAGYGDAAIDPTALSYYRYAWAVQDMGAYAEEALFSPQLGEQSHLDAARGFMDLFGPGNIVEIAQS